MYDLESRVSAIETDLNLIKYNLEQLRSWISAQATLRERAMKAAQAADADYHTRTMDV